jgi:hypothetical protein
MVQSPKLNIIVGVSQQFKRRLNKLVYTNVHTHIAICQVVWQLLNIWLVVAMVNITEEHTGVKLLGISEMVYA